MKKMRLTATVTFILVANSCFAAQLLSKNDFRQVESQYEKTGSIVTSGEMSPSDAKQELLKKAEEAGADVFVVTSADTDNKIHATADLYRKK